MKIHGDKFDDYIKLDTLLRRLRLVVMTGHGQHNRLGKVEWLEVRVFQI